MQKWLSTRRFFLQCGLTLLAVTPTIPAFLDQTVMALTGGQDAPATQRPSGKDDTILVVLQMSGGNDGLSMVVPYGDDAYYRARGDLAHEANTLLKLNEHIGLNGKLSGLKGLYDDGELAVIQGVGYPNPNRSHFRSMDIWQSGQPDKEVVTTGWIGRYFDNTCPGCDPHVGINMGDSLPVAMQGDRVTPLSFERPENYRYRGGDKPGYLALNQKDGVEPVVGAKANAKPQILTPQSQLDFLHRTAMDAQLSSDEILRITSAHAASKGAYPTSEFGNGLKTVAAMIAGGLPTRVYYVSLGGFDTHAGQLARYDALMDQLSQGLSAFWADLKSQGNDDRVLMMTFSEFGRRVAANASQGTDHGTAAPMLLMGKGIRQGVIGNHPSLTDLDQGDLKYGIDFRSVYSTILQDWLKTPSKPILGQQFQSLNVLRNV